MLKIEDYSFGRMVISGKTYSSDLKIYENEIIHPWWRRSGHVVEMGDVEDLLERGIETLIIGQGEPGMMKVSHSLKVKLKQRGIRLVELPTREAIRIFNQLNEEHPRVGAGFHLTC